MEKKQWLKDYEEDMLFEVKTGLYENNKEISEVGAIRKIYKKGKCDDIFADQLTNKISSTIIDDYELIGKQFGIDQFRIEKKDIEKIKDKIKNYNIIKKWVEEDIIYEIEIKYKNNKKSEQLIRIRTDNHIIIQRSIR